jgi:hypothetical protein
VKRMVFMVLLVAVIGLAGPFVPLDFLRPRIERAVERGLGRRVDVEGVYFSLFSELLSGPGFRLANVTIHEDPRAGIEPLAWVESLDARVRLLGLLHRRLEFSSLRLGGDSRINLVKTDAGPWNFQFLLTGQRAAAGAMPGVKMRGGRVNLKFGDTKSVLYFNDADLDVVPSEDGSVELRFSGAPSRTDRSAQNFGHFFVRGTWGPHRLDLKVELERSAIEELARLTDQRGFGLHGVVAFEAQISGPPSLLDVTGQLHVDDIHRWDLLPRGGGWSIPYKGALDLHGERLDLESSSEPADSPIALRFHASGFLSAPHWAVSANLKEIPLATALEVARHMGAAFPGKLEAEGAISGSVRYSDSEGPSGSVELQNASLTLPNAQQLRTKSAVLSIDREAMSLEPSEVRLGEKESVGVEGSYRLEPSGSLDLKITTAGLSVADLHSFGVAAIPVLEQTSQGTWRGWARYRRAPSHKGEWSGEYELQNARMQVDGLADPVRIQSAAVVLSATRTVVSKVRAKAGSIAFTGDYRWEPAAERPHKFHFVIPNADAGELERIWAPTLQRERGFLARTLGLGSTPLPEWLKTRRADGTLTVESFTMGETKMRIDAARLLWDATVVRLAGVSAHLDQAALAGDLAVDLSGRSPHYRFEGKLQDFAYKGGKLDFEGSVDADGAGAALVASLHGDGRLHGRSIAFAPDAEFRSVASCFEIIASRWKLSDLEVTQGLDTYSGQGATQADGRLQLELSNRGGNRSFTVAAR